MRTAPPHSPLPPINQRAVRTATALGLACLLVYALALLLAWRVAGRPPGLEQHLLRVALARWGARRTHTASQDAMEAHVKQPT